ncbi:hypothetical protein [Pedobacter sp. SL55]|uniref:hypothetical protein n=1 Tax=Pedobacter sp. SL55 TaxID=2995161 RepID=UPI002270E3A8|nr:hypothetical protein [Pedobacter sp. SL55]WAC39744.1 hypothetical protein OVA16_14315 [Pedobacter sp. SL55]
MHLTDYIQAYAAVGSLLVGTIGFFMIFQTFKLQASTFLEQQKLTKNEIRKLSLQYTPWLAYIKKIENPFGWNALITFPRKFTMVFELKNAEARELKIRMSEHNTGGSVEIMENVNISFIKIGDFISLEICSFKETIEGPMSLEFYFCTKNLLDEDYEQFVCFDLYDASAEPIIHTPTLKN